MIEDNESNTGKMTLYSVFHVSCKKPPFPERAEEPTTELMCTPAQSLPNVTGIIRVIFKETTLTLMQQVLQGKREKYLQVIHELVGDVDDEGILDHTTAKLLPVVTALRMQKSNMEMRKIPVQKNS